MIVLLRTVIARVKTFYEKLSQPFSCELLAVYFQNLLGEKFPNLMLVVSSIGAFLCKNDDAFEPFHLPQTSKFAMKNQHHRGFK